jgi:hypothetical protein
MTGPSLDTIKAQNKRLYDSITDIEHALYCAGVLIKGDWRHIPDGRSQVASQVAYTTAMTVSYGRLFTESNGWPGFPERLLRDSYDEAERKLHQTILGVRHSLYAHTDSGWYTIDHQITSDGRRQVRSTSSGYLLDTLTIERFATMAMKLRVAIVARMAELEPQIPARTAESTARRFPL